MADVTVGVGIDATAATLTLFEVMAKADEATAKLVAVRRKALTIIGQVNSMVTQSYGVLKQLVERAGGMIDPFFDMAFNMISSIISTSISGALLMMSSLNPALVTFGVALMAISLEISLANQLELARSRGVVTNIVASMKNAVSPPTGITGVSF